ncbi:hypothetical protein GCM10011316_13350 [Roseibium aquae]|uniref:Uncharacterized protein n=1 Tax=Roseibium aquae TaxID=1323746 RepID=A0A916WZG7_9HYPH|nr:hypothetical protein [Roseibium aquae]GGB42773.1 hypothetical protein GCM10011316_13350 [Roseibium aquae]
MSKTPILGRFRLPENPLLRLLLVNGLLGVLISFIFLAGVLAANVGNLRVLILNADNPVLPVLMLIVSLIVTLGSVVMGSAIMMLREPDQKRPGGGQRIKTAALQLMDTGDMVLVPVPVRPRRQG